MKHILIIFSVAGIILSGCIENPAKQVPVVNVNISLSEKNGIVELENYLFTQGTINYVGRPKKTHPDSFPAITARASIQDKNTSKVQWEALPYKGNGSYSFDVGFVEGDYPSHKDKVNIFIYVWDEKGEIIGRFVYDMTWE